VTKDNPDDHAIPVNVGLLWTHIAMNVEEGSEMQMGEGE
jgi:hypothetical protein